MKRFFSLIQIAVSVLLLASCSEMLDENERYVEIPLPDVKRNVLIEDFTGQTCVNCPDAAVIIHELQEQYGSDVVVAVGVYSGPFGRVPSPKDISLVTDLGKAYWDRWFEEDAPQPIGLINRSRKLGKDDWKKAVMEALSTPTKMTLGAEAFCDTVGCELAARVAVTGPENTECQLQVLLLEDGIQAVQTVNGRNDRTYIHNHVLRASFNGTWGETLILGGATTEKSYTLALAEDWNPEHLQLVAFVVLDDEVQQVISIPVQIQKHK